MTAAGQQLHLRLFLEGIEVPIISCQVQCNINAPATASIQIVPTDKVIELKARTMVHVFFWDYTLDLNVSNEPLDPLDVEDSIKGYKLLFSGEVVGYSLMKTPLGRQAVLQCADFSTYWDTTYQFMVSVGNFGSQGAVWAGGGAFNDIFDGHVTKMNEYLHKRPSTPGLKDVKGLMGGIISVLELMGGISNQHHGVNDFFTIAELKNHLMQQIVAEQDDDTARRLFDEETFMKWLTGSLGSLGQLATFRDMLKLLFQFIYYECIPNPSPKYVPGESKKTTVTDKTFVFPSSVRNKLVDLLKRTSILAGSATFDSARITETDSGFGDVGTNEDSENKAGFDKRTQAGDLRDELKPLRGVKNLIVRVKDKIDLAIGVLDTVAHAGQTYTDANLRVQFRAASNHIGEALEAGGVAHSERFRKVENTRPKVDRLYTQIFRPDCFFAAPPKCNIFFPEIYTSFNYSRNYLQEVTRLRLMTSMTMIPQSAFTVDINFAPSTKDIKEMAKKQGNSSVRALLPWEKYSGILPKFESMHEIQKAAGYSERKLGIKKNNIKGQATSYGQRAANFNYFKYRFASRGCDVSMKFNPFVVCGFPAALITQPFSPTPLQLDEAIQALTLEQGKQFTAQDVSDNIRLVARKIGAPTHFLGMVAGFSHMVSQDGGVTSVSLTHARSHRITDDDFMGVWLAEYTKDSRKQTKVTVLDTQQLLDKGDYTNLKYVFSATDQKSVITNIQISNDSLSSGDSTDKTSDAEFIALLDRPTGVPTLQDQDKLSSVKSKSEFSLLLLHEVEMSHYP